MGITGNRVEKSSMGGRARARQGLVLQNFFIVVEVYVPPTATRGAWAFMSPAQADPGSSLTIPSDIRRLKPEKKEDNRREEWVPTWRTSSPSVKDHVKNAVFSEYPRNNWTRSRVAAAAQRLGATANAVRQNRPRKMRKWRWKQRRAPSAGCSVLRRAPRDIILVTLWMMPAQSQISRGASHLPLQILNSLMTQNGNHCREGQPPPEYPGTWRW